MQFLRKLFGRYRLWMGFCPSCNSSAPKCDHCSACMNYRELIAEPHHAADVWLRFERRGYR